LITQEVTPAQVIEPVVEDKPVADEPTTVAAPVTDTIDN